MVHRRQQRATNHEGDVAELRLEALQLVCRRCRALFEFFANAVEILLLVSRQRESLSKLLDIAEKRRQRAGFVAEEVRHDRRTHMLGELADLFDDLNRGADRILLHRLGDFFRVQPQRREGLELGLRRARAARKSLAHVAERGRGNICLGASRDHGRAESEGLFLRVSEELALRSHSLRKVDEVSRTRRRGVRHIVDGVGIGGGLLICQPEGRPDLRQRLAGFGTAHLPRDGSLGNHAREVEKVLVRDAGLRGRS